MSKHRVGDKVKGGGSGGDPNIMKLKESNRIRIVDRDMAFWKQHVVEDLTDPDGDAEFVVCPGPAVCPLDRKPVRVEKVKQEDGTFKDETIRNWPISKRYGMNVWDYDEGAVKVLIVGPSIYDEIQGADEVGFDLLGCDWRIHKSGTGIATKYRVVRADSSEFSEAEIKPEDLHDLSKYDDSSPPSVEAIFEIIEKKGYDYDNITVPTYTEEEALEYVIPFGQCKGMTIEQALASNGDWCEWLHGTRLSDGQIGDPLFIALQTAMEARDMVEPLDEVLAQTAPSAEPQQDAAPEAQDEPEDDIEGPDADPDTVTLLSQDGSEEIVVPVGAKDAMLAAGFKEKPQEEPKVPAFTDDTEIDVKVSGVGVTMTVAAVRAARDAGAEIEVVDPVASAFMNPDTNGDSAADVVREEAAEGKVEQPAADKPFTCDVEGCDWGGKTKGALTQHKKREHGDPEQHSTEPATSNGDAGSKDDREAAMDRVKTLLDEGAYGNDYTELLKMFEEVTGKRDVSKFSLDELTQVEEILKKKAAEAA